MMQKCCLRKVHQPSPPFPFSFQCFRNFLFRSPVRKWLPLFATPPRRMPSCSRCQFRRGRAKGKGGISFTVVRLGSPFCTCRQRVRERWNSPNQHNKKYISVQLVATYSSKRLLKSLFAKLGKLHFTPVQHGKPPLNAGAKEEEKQRAKLKPGSHFPPLLQQIVAEM